MNLPKAIAFVNKYYDSPARLILYRITHISPFNVNDNIVFSGLIVMKKDDAHNKDLATHLEEKKQKMYERLFGKELKKES